MRNAIPNDIAGKQRIAEDPSSLPEDLCELANDEDVSIHARDRATTTFGRGYASPKRDYPPEWGGFQPEFVFDEYVRRYTAGNPSTPQNVLCELAEDMDEDVWQAVAWNPSTPFALKFNLRQRELYDSLCEEAEVSDDEPDPMPS
jgi:hypothetical protein